MPKTAACGNGWPCSRRAMVPATSVSPAPTVVATCTFGGLASQRPSGPMISAPSPPMDTTTRWMLWAFCSSSAALISSAVSFSERPTSSSSSERLGLIMTGPTVSETAFFQPSSTAPSCEPATSMTRFTPLSTRVLARWCQMPTSHPGGRLPPNSHQSPRRTRDSMRSLSSCSSLARSSGSSWMPGRFTSVDSPASWSTSLTLVRVAPGRRIMASRMPLSSKAWTNSLSLSAPIQPVAVVATPSLARMMETPMPLPPGVLVKPVARCTSPGISFLTGIVWSIAGLRVMVRTWVMLHLLRVGKRRV